MFQMILVLSSSVISSYGRCGKEGSFREINDGNCLKMEEMSQVMWQMSCESLICGVVSLIR